MRLTFLGTGGSEGYPATFCRCPRCQTARDIGGPNIRRRTSVLIDDKVLIDFGPDVPASLQTLGLDLAPVEHLLVTHPHDDHFLPVTLKYRHPRDGAPDLPTLCVHGGEASLNMLDHLPFGLDELRASASPITAGEWFDAGGYRVLPLAANHAPGLQAVLYVVMRDGTGVLYATDTGAFRPESWEALEGLELGAAVIETTYWDHEAAAGGQYHMTIDQAVCHACRLHNIGALRDEAPVYATHICHRSLPDHFSLTERFAGTDMQPAYDGLSVSI